MQTTTIENFGNQTDYGVEILNVKSMIIVIIVKAIKFIFCPISFVNRINNILEEKQKFNQNKNY